MKNSLNMYTDLIFNLIFYFVYCPSIQISFRVSCILVIKIQATLKLFKDVGV